jgi:membrane associated rhomboid family serine protease
MGIYDREYYRREGPSILGSFSGQGQVCKWLILINVVAFLFQLVVVGFTQLLELDPTAVQSGEVWRLLTYAFLHDPGQPMHILFNMLFLWWFGKDMEDLYGAREFLAFYLVSAFLGGLAYFAWAVYGHIPVPCIGASGAVTAVMVLFAFHYPRRQIWIWFLLPVPIWAFVAFQVAQDTLLFVGRVPTSTAVTVHLAGAAFALLYHQGHWRLLNWWPNFRLRQRARPNLRVYREEADATAEPLPPAAPRDADEQLEAKLDAVLEKVARFGQASLTEAERQILVRASEVYRRRRT